MFANWCSMEKFNIPILEDIFTVNNRYHNQSNTHQYFALGFNGYANEPVTSSGDFYRLSELQLALATFP